MGSTKSKRILIAPLDWGLGHTTRCIPIIKHVINSGHTPVFAGNQSQINFIRKSIGDIETIFLEGYNVRFNGSMFHLVKQIPRILQAIKGEHKWLNENAEKLNISGIISDNRYGMYHSTIPSVVLTHQLMVKSGWGEAIDSWLQKIHYRFLNRFGEVWIPDNEQVPNAGGSLSHPVNMPVNAKYLGLLSRFEDLKIESGNDEKHLLILLSGPEPQRTVFSNLLWRQVAASKEKIVFVEGTDSVQKKGNIPLHVTYHKLLTEEELAGHISDAKLVICRSGYSTIMDLLMFEKKAFLVPTPAQTEQEYLAKQLHNRGIFYAGKQNNFDVNAAIKASEKFPFYQLDLKKETGRYRSVLNRWIENL